MVSILVSVLSEREVEEQDVDVVEELDVDVFVCFSIKLSFETPRFGKYGTGWVIPTDPPETLPGAAEYAMAASTFMPMNCAFAVEVSKINPITKQDEKHSLFSCFVLFNIRHVNKILEIKHDTKTHHIAFIIIFFSVLGTA